MKAYVYRRYGGPEVVELAEVPTPTPGANEVLVRVVATTVSSGDWRVRTLDVPKGLGVFVRLALGVTRPRQPIMGTELSGVVEAVGANVTRFREGDAVFAFPGGKMGAHAEYVTLPEDGPVARKPEGLGFEEAAALCFGGCTALDFLNKAAIQHGEKLLVIGASGAVGSALVQLGKARGAEVTGVTSTRNLDLVRSLGADHVIDHTKESATKGAVHYDVIADTVGATTFADSKTVLAKGGRFLAIAGGLADMLSTMRPAGAARQKVLAGPAAERPEYVAQMKTLVERGAFRPVIDSIFAFDQMREAHALVATGHKRGSVVVRVSPDP